MQCITIVLVRLPATKKNTYACCWHDNKKAGVAVRNRAQISESIVNLLGSHKKHNNVLVTMMHVTQPLNHQRVRTSQLLQEP